MSFEHDDNCDSINLDSDGVARPCDCHVAEIATLRKRVKELEVSEKNLMGLIACKPEERLMAALDTVEDLIKENEALQSRLSIAEEWIGRISTDLCICTGTGTGTGTTVGRHLSECEVLRVSALETLPKMKEAK